MTEQLSTLTVGELIEALQSCDSNLPVVLAYDYGDHTHTTCTNQIGQYDADEAEIEWSEYHRSFTLSSGEPEYDDDGQIIDDDERQIAVVIGPKNW